MTPFHAQQHYVLLVYVTALPRYILGDTEKNHDHSWNSVCPEHNGTVSLLHLAVLLAHRRTGQQSCLCAKCPGDS